MTRFLVLTIAGLTLGLGSVAHSASDVSMQLLSGEEVSLSGARDKPLYLKFWASWCGQCLAQMPHLQEIHENHGADIDVVAVNFGVNDTPEQIVKIQRKFEMTMPIAYDELGALSRSFEVAVAPYSIIIDRDGSIAHRGWGDDGVDEKIAELIQNQP